jgi:hypothetical protein
VQGCGFFGGCLGGFGGYFGWGGYFGGWGFGGLAGYFGYGDWDPITGWSGYTGGTSTTPVLGRLRRPLHRLLRRLRRPLLPDPKPPLPLEAGYWDLPQQIDYVLYADSNSAAASSGHPADLVTEQAFKKAQETSGLQVAATSDAIVSEPPLDRFDVLHILANRSPEVGVFFASRGQLSTSPLADRPAPQEAPPTTVEPPVEAHASEAPDGSLAAEKLSWCSPPE